MTTKLNVSNIDGFPNTALDNSYLRMNNGKYETISPSKLNEIVGDTSKKPNSVFSGNNSAIDYSIARIDTYHINATGVDGCTVTTNASGYSSSWPLTMITAALDWGGWCSNKINNAAVTLQCPRPTSYTRYFRKLPHDVEHISNFTSMNCIIESSNDGNSWIIQANHTLAALIPYKIEEIKFNPSNTEYLFWRVRFPTPGLKGTYFSGLFTGSQPLSDEAYVEKDNIIINRPMALVPTIPYRTTYTDVLGGYCGGNGGEYANRCRYWRAFRGYSTGEYESGGYFTLASVVLPKYVYYRPQQRYTAGKYAFQFCTGTWNHSDGFPATRTEIRVKDTSNNIHILYTLNSPKWYNQYNSTPIIDIPFDFTEVQWYVTQDYHHHFSFTDCQVFKLDENANFYNYLSHRTATDLKNKFSHRAGTTFFKNPKIEYNVSVDKPLQVAFSNSAIHSFTSVDPLELKHEKCYVLQTPYLMVSNSQQDTTLTNGWTEYNRITDGYATGNGGIHTTNDYYKGIGSEEYRGSGDTYLSAQNLSTAGLTYYWDDYKEAGTYIFQFFNGNWNYNHNCSIKKVSIRGISAINNNAYELVSLTNLNNEFDIRYWTNPIYVPFPLKGVQLYIEDGNHDYFCVNHFAVYREERLDNIPYLLGTQEYNEAHHFIKYFEETQNIFINNLGDTFALSSKIYSQQEEPIDAVEDDVWRRMVDGTSQQLIKNQGQWVNFEAVHLSTATLFNHIIKDQYEIPFNNNGTYRTSEDIWTTEVNIKMKEPTAFYMNSDVDTRFTQYEYNIAHGLNIQDISKYKPEVYLKCTREDLHYEVGEYVPFMIQSNGVDNYASPYLTKHNIGICSGSDENGFSVIHNTTGVLTTITDKCWKLVFKIRKL